MIVSFQNSAASLATYQVTARTRSYDANPLRSPNTQQSLDAMSCSCTSTLSFNSSNFTVTVTVTTLVRVNLFHFKQAGYQSGKQVFHAQIFMQNSNLPRLNAGRNLQAIGNLLQFSIIEDSRFSWRLACTHYFCASIAFNSIGVRTISSNAVKLSIK